MRLHPSILILGVVASMIAGGTYVYYAHSTALVSMRVAQALPPTGRTATPPHASTPGTQPSSTWHTSTPVPSFMAVLGQLGVPTSYRDAFILYAVIDRPGGDASVRRLYIDPPSLVAAAQAGGLPLSAVIVMETWDVARDDVGKPVIDADGRLLPTALDSIALRTSHQSYLVPTADLPAQIRNGTWNYVTVDPVAADVQSTNSIACHACHNQAADWDYLYSFPQLTEAAATGQMQYARCDLLGRQPCALPETQLDTHTPPP